MRYPRTKSKALSPAELWAREERRARARKLVERLLLQIKAWRLPTPETEVKFHPTRKWRLDVAWREFMVAVEVDGITGGEGGGHQRAGGFENDREKDLAARELGWDVIRVTGRLIKSGSAIRAIAQALSKASGVRA
jgi:very-short-patch-repair endonuclease